MGRTLTLCTIYKHFYFDTFYYVCKKLWFDCWTVHNVSYLIVSIKLYDMSGIMLVDLPQEFSLPLLILQAEG